MDEVVPLAEEHLDSAAALVSSRYRALRKLVPSLPARYAHVSTLLPLLHDIAGAGPAVAAMRGGQLVGFLSAWLVPSFRGRRSVFSPEWANAAGPEDTQRIYDEMYAYLAAAWVAEGYFTHLVSLLANDQEGHQAWHWLGFGMIAADGVRDLQPAQGPETDVEIWRAGPQDVEKVMALNEALARYLAASPTFLADTEQRDRAYYQAWLQDPEKAIWLAYNGCKAVAYLGLGPASEDASTIIRDEKTASIFGAFAEEQARGQGIATALLNRSLAWAHAAGYARCAVDFEPMNPLASRFWLRHFEPVCYTLVRPVDEPAVAA